MKSIDGFIIDTSFTIVDQRKSIHSYFRLTMKNDDLFLDLMHVKKNMSPIIGAEKSQCHYIYGMAVQAPCSEKVDDIKSIYMGQNRQIIWQSSRIQKFTNPIPN